MKRKRRKAPRAGCVMDFLALCIILLWAATTR